jgi:hypothetical protein
MSATVAHSLDGFPRRKQARAELRGESVCQKLAPRQLGPVFTRAIALSGKERKEIAVWLGYVTAGGIPETSVIGKWEAGTENIQIERIWACPLRTFWVEAQAEACGQFQVERVYRRVTA